MSTNTQLKMDKENVEIDIIGLIKYYIINNIHEWVNYLMGIIHYTKLIIQSECMSTYMYLST